MAASEKRERILESALSVFARKGFYNAKVSEIAQAAGVADGTIYLYFKSKDNLLISLFEDRMSWLIQRLAAELEPIEGTLAKLELYICLHLELANVQPLLAEFLTVELRQSAKFVREYSNPRFNEYLNVLRSLIDQACEEGLFRKVDAKLVSRAIFGALDELLLSMVLSRREEIPVKYFSQQIWTLFFEGLMIKGKG